MYDRNFDKGSKKEEEKFSDSKPRHFPRKWPRQKHRLVRLGWLIRHVSLVRLDRLVRLVRLVRVPK